MTKPPASPQPPAALPAKPTREERLAQQLRDNLRRRKASGQGADTASPDDPRRLS